MTPANRTVAGAPPMIEGGVDSAPYWVDERAEVITPAGLHPRLRDNAYALAGEWGTTASHTAARAKTLTAGLLNQIIRDPFGISIWAHVGGAGSFRNREFYGISVTIPESRP